MEDLVEVQPEFVKRLVNAGLQQHACTLPQLKGRWAEERWVVIVGWLAEKIAERFKAQGIRFFRAKPASRGDFSYLTSAPREDK